ncbi:MULTISPECIES: tachylectin-related carbohydrate-binding protein [unclassified Streptomyces]|uniref:tachylectin-related carbohydrate-binding protein n=1 Tax=unclassified Streptomyces TaxID=2593676 RepID=UPI003437BD94
MTLNSPRRTGRWTALVMAAAATAPLLAALPGTAHAAVPLTCNTSGPTYAIDSAGKLLRQDMPGPGVGNALPTATTIDTGWSGYGRMLAGPAGAFYGIKTDGLYYSHRISATATWDVHHKKISTGFTEFRTGTRTDDITMDRGGNLWTFQPSSGGLRWWRYDAAADDFVADGGKIVDMGWDRYDAIYAGDKGVLFGRSATDGKLYRSRYDYTSQRWLERHVLVSAADWSDTKYMSSYGGDTLFRVKGNGEVRYYRYDETLGNFPVYNKLVESSGWAAYTSVSTTPDSCRLDSNHTPATPAVPLEFYSRGSAMRSPSGSLEYAFTDNIGWVHHGRQSDPSDFNSVKWTTISGTDSVNETFTGQPTLAAHDDGRVVVSAHTTSGALWQRNQAAVSSADWGNWINLSGAMAQHAITGKTPSGLLVQFSSDASGNPWYRIQQRANVDFMGWMPLGGSGFEGPFTAVTVRDGIQLFGRNASGVLSTALFKEAGTLSAWTPLGAQGVTGTPAVIVYPGYRLRVFATDGNGSVVTTVQSAEGGAYGAWSTVDGVTAQGSPTALISPVTGITEVLVRGTDGTIYNTGETLQGTGIWRPWQQPTTEQSATEPTAFEYSNTSGPTWAYMFRTADHQTRVYTLDLGFSRMARSAPGAAGSPADAPAFTGRTLPAPPQAK